MNAFDGTPKLRPISGKKPSETELQPEDQFKPGAYNNYRPREHFYNHFNSRRQHLFNSQNSSSYYNKYFYENSNLQQRDPRSTNPSFRINVERFSYTQQNRVQNYTHPCPVSLNATHSEPTLACENNIYEKNNKTDNVHRHSNSDHISSNWNEKRNHKQIFNGSNFYRKTYLPHHNKYTNYKEFPVSREDVFQQPDKINSELLHLTQKRIQNNKETSNKDLTKNSDCLEREQINSDILHLTQRKINNSTETSNKELKTKEFPVSKENIFEKPVQINSEILHLTQNRILNNKIISNKDSKNSDCRETKSKSFDSPEKEIKSSSNEERISKEKKEHKIKDKNSKQDKIDKNESKNKKSESGKKDLKTLESKKLKSNSSKEKTKGKKNPDKIDERPDKIDEKKSIQFQSKNEKPVESNNNNLDKLEPEIQKLTSPKPKALNSRETTPTLKHFEGNRTFVTEDFDLNLNISTRDESVLLTQEDNSTLVSDSNTLNKNSSEKEPENNGNFRQTLRVVPLYKLMHSTYEPSECEVEKTTVTETYTLQKTKKSNDEDNVIDKILRFDRSKIKRIISYPSIFDDLLRKEGYKTYQKRIRTLLTALEPGKITDPRIFSEFQTDETVDDELMSQELIRELQNVIKANDSENNYVPEIDGENIVNKLNPGLTDFREQEQVLEDMENNLGRPEDNFNILKINKNSHEEDVKQNIVETESSLPLCQENLKSILEHDKTSQQEDSLGDVRMHIQKSSRSINSERRRRKRKNKSEVVIVDSSSSSCYSLSSSDDTDGDEDSYSSHASVASAQRRRQLKKKVLEKSVVNNFDKLILPSINESLKERYRTKFSNTDRSKLHFISCICTSNYNSEHFSKYDIAKIQRNINEEDNSHALDFLAQQIVNVFNNIENIIKRGKVLNQNRNNEIQSDNNGPMTSETLNNQSVNIAEQILGDEKICVTSKNHTICARNPNEMQLLSEQNQSQEPLNDLEKKFSGSEDCEMDIERYPGTEKQKRLNERKTNNDNWNISYMQTEGVFPHVDVNFLKQNSLLKKSFIMNIRQIDMKLVEMHRRQMFIDEMIMKLQKDKMDANLMATQLESEKYMLLNAALASNVVSNGPGVDYTTETTPENSNQGKLKRKQRSCAEENQHSKRLPANKNIRKQQKKTSYKSKTNKICNVRMKKRAKRDTVKDSKTQNKTEENIKVNQINDDTALGLGSTQVVNNMEQDIEHEMKDTINQMVNEVDYSDIESGYLENIQSPVTVICTIENYIIAGTEDGNIYQFNFRTLKCELRYNKHVDTITDICLCPKSNLIYTTSLDGYLKISNIQNLKIDMQSVNLQEPLQTIDIEWDIGYIGSRWGNVFTYNIEANKINVSPLCSSNSSITSIKATKEGVRKVILLSCRGNVLGIRDANTGILLRTLNLPSSLRISSVLLDRGWIYCGTFKKEVYKFDFLTGSHLATLMCGNGAVSMELYKQRFLLVGCYDGLIYVIDTDTSKCVAQFSGSGRMVLTLKVLGDKVITSAKNKTLQIIDIPKHVVVTAMAHRTNL